MCWARHLVKLLKAVDLIARPEGATVDNLAEHLEVSRRTAYRVIETLDEMKFPLFEDTSSGPSSRSRVIDLPAGCRPTADLFCTFS